MVMPGFPQGTVMPWGIRLAMLEMEARALEAVIQYGRFLGG